jgi:ribosomal protein L15
MFESGAIVSRTTLTEKGILNRAVREVKIVGPSTSLGASGFSKKLTIQGVIVSASARAAIEKAGGTVA